MDLLCIIFFNLAKSTRNSSVWPIRQNHVYQKSCYINNFPMNTEYKRINTSTLTAALILFADDKSLSTSLYHNSTTTKIIHTKLLFKFTHTTRFQQTSSA
jgi:hypothetical protein